MSRHSVRKMGYMVSFQPIRKSTLFDHIILAVDNLGAIVIEDHDTIEYVAFYLGCPHANTSFDLLVQVYISLLDNFHVLFASEFISKLLDYLKQLHGLISIF